MEANKKQLTNSEEQFQAIRTLQSIEEYSKILFDPANDGSVQRNTIMHIVGFDNTGHMKGDVRYGALNNKRIQLIQRELNFRNIPFDAADRIRKLGKFLKQADLHAQRDQIELEIGTLPKQSDLNDATFIPLSQTANDYRIVEESTVVNDWVSLP